MSNAMNTLLAQTSPTFARVFAEIAAQADLGPFADGECLALVDDVPIQIAWENILGAESLLLQTDFGFLMSGAQAGVCLRRLLDMNFTASVSASLAFCIVPMTTRILAVRRFALTPDSSGAAALALMRADARAAHAWSAWQAQQMHAVTAAVTDLPFDLHSLKV